MSQSSRAGETAERIGPRPGGTGGTVIEVCTDTWEIALPNLAAAHTYRIVTKIVARPPLVVRASFHDYLCEDYRISRAYFTPIIDSLNLRE